MSRPTLARTFAAVAAATLILAVSGCSATDMRGPVAADSKAEDAATPAAGTYAGASASERKVARSAELTLAITDPAKSARDVRTAAESLGGYVLNENVVTEQKDGFYLQPSSVTVSVPSAKLDDALDALAKLGDVRSRVVNAADVTTQVVDTEARIKTMRESIARIEALMAKTGSVTEIATVERELTSRQSELESLVAQQQALADRVAMAPITVTLRPSSVTADPNPLWQGLSAGWSALLASVRILVTVVGGLAPFAVLALIVWLPLRWWRRRARSATRAGTPSAQPAETSPTPAEPEASLDS